MYTGVPAVPFVAEHVYSDRASETPLADADAASRPGEEHEIGRHQGVFM